MNLTDLPYEILELIAAKLAASEVISLATVNRELCRRLLNNNNLFQNLAKRDFMSDCLIPPGTCHCFDWKTMYGLLVELRNALIYDKKQCWDQTLPFVRFKRINASFVCYYSEFFEEQEARFDFNSYMVGLRLLQWFPSPTNVERLLFAPEYDENVKVSIKELNLNEQIVATTWRLRGDDCTLPTWGIGNIVEEGIVMWCVEHQAYELIFKLEGVEQLAKAIIGSGVRPDALSE